MIKLYYGFIADKSIKSTTMCKLLHKCRSRYASVQTSNVLLELACFDLNLFYFIAIIVKSSD